MEELTLKQLETERLEIAKEMNLQKEAMDDVMARIAAKIGDTIAETRKNIGKDTGVVDCEMDGCIAKHDLPKKVEYDQDGMKELRKKILEAEGNPDDYITTKPEEYSMSEKVYKALGDEQRAEVDKIRNVKVGKPKITITIKEED